MGNKFQEQIMVIPRADMRESVSTMEASFFDAAGNELTVGFTPATAVADITAADATDLATALVLANATKASVNEILAALRVAGLMASA